MIACLCLVAAFCALFVTPAAGHARAAAGDVRTEVSRSALCVYDMSAWPPPVGFTSCIWSEHLMEYGDSRYVGLYSMLLGTCI